MHEAHLTGTARELPRPSAKAVSGTRRARRSATNKKTAKRQRSIRKEEAAAKKLDTRRPAWLCSGDESRCGALNVRVYHTDALEMTPETGGLRTSVSAWYPRQPSVSAHRLAGLGMRPGRRGSVAQMLLHQRRPALCGSGSYELAVVERFPRPYWIDTGTTRERAFGTHVYDSQTVTVSAGQTQEVTLTIYDK